VHEIEEAAAKLGVLTNAVLVCDNNLKQALRVLKRKLQREGLFREMKRASFYEKPSEKAGREKCEAIRRARKLARKAIREGLIHFQSLTMCSCGRPALRPAVAPSCAPRTAARWAAMLAVQNCSQNSSQ
jgi:small subunit ribosomal protein S21